MEVVITGLAASIFFTLTSESRYDLIQFSKRVTHVP